MTGWMQCITEYRWADLLTVWFCLVDDACQVVEARRQAGANKQRKAAGRKQRFSDSEVITVALFCDAVFGGHEAKTLKFLREYHRDLFPNLLSPSRFNHRRTRLAARMEEVRLELSHHYQLVQPNDLLRLIDSAPVYACTYQRSSDCVTIATAAQESDRSIKEYIGRSAKDHAYFAGFRLVVGLTHSQHIDRCTLVPASVHDSQSAEDIFAETPGCTYLADNAYRVPNQSEQWYARYGVIVQAPPRRNSATPWPAEYRTWQSRQRRRIETVFSILASAFHIERPGSRSWQGLLSRTFTQLLAYTLCGVTNLLLERQVLPQLRN